MENFSIDSIKNEKFKNSKCVHAWGFIFVPNSEKVTSNKGADAKKVVACRLKMVNPMDRE